VSWHRLPVQRAEKLVPRFLDWSAVQPLNGLLPLESWFPDRISGQAMRPCNGKRALNRDPGPGEVSASLLRIEMGPPSCGGAGVWLRSEREEVGRANPSSANIVRALSARAIFPENFEDHGNHPGKYPEHPGRKGRDPRTAGPYEQCEFRKFSTPDSRRVTRWWGSPTRAKQAIEKSPPIQSAHRLVGRGKPNGVNEFAIRHFENPT